MTKPSLLCSNGQQTIEARFFSPRPARLWWRSVCERTGRSNRTVFQRRAQTNRHARTVKSSGRVRRDLKSFAAHRPDSRGNIVERVLSLDAHVHYQTKPSLLFSNGQQTIEARFFSPRPARLWWRSVCERTGRSNRTVFNGALKRTTHRAPSPPSECGVISNKLSITSPTNWWTLALAEDGGGLATLG